MHETDFNGTSLSECCFTLHVFFPEYTQILKESQVPYSRLVHARNVVARGGDQPGSCTSEVLSNLLYLALVVWVVATTQTSSKINICMEKIDPKLQLQPPHLLKVTSLWWYWASYHDSMWFYI